MSSAKVVCFGEILIDRFPNGDKPGGAPFNVCAHLVNLGVPAILVSRVGDDDHGYELTAFAKSKGISTTQIQLDRQLPTGTVDVEKLPNGDSKYTINENVAWDRIQAPDNLEVVQDRPILVFGSLAMRSESNYSTLQELMTIPFTTVFDVNLRAPFVNRERIIPLLNSSNIVKMNDDEIEAIADWFDISGDLESIMKDLHKRCELDEIFVTRGSDGALAYDGNTMADSPGYSVDVTDTTGSGDSFLAGLLLSKIEGKGLDESLDFACSVGSTVARFSGAIPNVSIEDIENTKRGTV